ncbi:CapA family protein [Paraburkholderia sp. UYCP14C]|uniref:CapA family protein n=1 Tax=Paraburkholderia sp. UYCP14C TaxID=2511130 RepID=UPI0010218D78|nr:CapA family protein [Paraburkholderia sp. UYCP14C]RZF24542.1 CapA family protein [Paraburkholderia sp. UYCP14C]
MGDGLGNSAASHTQPLCLFLCGDVMPGRGIDRILPHPGRPQLFEPYVRSAKEYVKFAERASGKLPLPAGYAYPWGDTLTVLAQRGPHARIINLETAVTSSDAHWPNKAIHYRMHPANLACLTEASIDCCVLANNHVLDWGRAGLDETLRSLHEAGIRTAGAGRDASQAAAPAIVDIAGRGRVLVYAYGCESAGVPQAWAARAGRAGVNYLPDYSLERADAIARHVARGRCAGDVVVISLHWGGNWGFGVSSMARAFARRLVDEGAADVIHGHSSHHIQGIEIYHGKPVLYGCGDFLNDYEGIPGHESYRPDLTLMYFPVVNPASGNLVEFTAVPMQIRHFRTGRAPDDGASWLHATLSRESSRYGVDVKRDACTNTFTLRW